MHTAAGPSFPYAVRSGRTLWVAIVGAFFAVGVSAPHAAVNRTACTGYAQKRIFLGSQEWWLPAVGMNGTDQGHVHAEMCAPHRQRVTGRIALDVRVVMHDNPGHISIVAVKAVQSNGGTVIGERRISFDCPPPMTCSRWVRVIARTRLARYNGWTELRVKAQGRTNDGFTRSSILRFGVFLTNGKPRNDYFKGREAGGSGWYEDAAYANARVISRIPYRAVSGVWTLKTSFDLTPESNGAGDEVTHRFVSVDPMFHDGDPGKVIVDAAQAGDWAGAIRLDTTRLANGRHKLFLRADADDPRGSTNSGVLVVPFRVRN
jgi:hypothetical protein